MERDTIEKPRPPMPEGQICMEEFCKRPATIDYNGCGHFVCEPCDERLNRYFDEEYR